MKMQEIGRYWTATKSKEHGWQLRQCRTEIDKTVAYAERMNMMNEGEVYVLQVVGKIGYALKESE